MSLIHYLLEANLYLVAFYLLYVLLLRSETLYQLNRAYLLVTSLLAFIIPIVQLGILKPGIKHGAQVGMVSLDMNTAALVPMPQVVAEVPKWSSVDYVLAAYACISIVMLGFLIFKIVKLIALSKQGNAKRQDGFVVIEIPGDNVAFSFFGYLFVNRELSASQTVMNHEEVHIRQKHSWDVIWFELLKIFNWFNPAIYLIEKSMKEVHEFIADQQVAQSGNGAEEYADFLISNAYGITQNQLTNSFFNKNLLKRRIIMLYQKKSGRAARLKYLLTLPLMGGLLCASTLAFTTKDYGVVDIAPKAKAIIANLTDSANAAPKADDQSEYAKGWRQAEQDMKSGKTQPQNAVKFPKPKTVIIKGIEGDPVYNAVEKNPSFPGGEPAFYQFLVKNVKYPKEALSNNITGRAFVQFIVEPTGSLTDVKIVRDPGYGLGNEAVRVLKLSPKWSPGVQKGKKVRVMYTVPVNFSIADDGKKNSSAGSSKSDSVYNAVDVNPTFPGGEAAFGKFLRDNIRYPKEAKDKNVTGRTFTQFIVEKDGSLSNLKTVRDPGTGLGPEALRVLALSPKWSPGKKNGELVRVMYTVPINFSLADDAAGNFNDFGKYIRDHVRYPRAAKEADIQGQSIASFTVNDQKQIQDLKMLKSPDQSISDEIMRVLRNFKTITDAKPDVTYIIPVSMAIDHGNGANRSSDKSATDIAKLYNKGNNVVLNEISVTAYGVVR